MLHLLLTTLQHTMAPSPATLAILSTLSLLSLFTLKPLTRMAQPRAKWLHRFTRGGNTGFIILGILMLLVAFATFIGLIYFLAIGNTLYAILCGIICLLMVLLTGLAGHGR